MSLVSTSRRDKTSAGQSQPATLHFASRPPTIASPAPWRLTKRSSCKDAAICDRSLSLPFLFVPCILYLVYSACPSFCRPFLRFAVVSSHPMLLLARDAFWNKRGGGPADQAGGRTGGREDGGRQDRARKYKTSAACASVLLLYFCSSCFRGALDETLISFWPSLQRPRLPTARATVVRQCCGRRKRPQCHVQMYSGVFSVLYF